MSSYGLKTRACPDDEDKVSEVASVRSSTSLSSTTSVRICAEAEREALLAKAAALQQEHATEEAEEQLEHQKVQLRRRRETLDMQAELSGKYSQNTIPEKCRNGT